MQLYTKNKLFEYQKEKFYQKRENVYFLFFLVPVFYSWNMKNNIYW